MAGSFYKLFEQSFTSTTSVTVVHGLDRLQVAVSVRIGNVARNDLIESAYPNPTDPRNEVIVTFASAQTGNIVVIDTDYVFSAIPTPENTAVLSGGTAMTANVYDPTNISADAFARANHTGTQTASTISDFDTEVTNNAAVTANTAKVTNATHTGDVAGSGVLTIQPNAVANSMLFPMPGATLKGNNTGTLAAPVDLTRTEVRTLLNVEDGADVTDATNVDAAGAVMDSDIAEAEGFLRKVGAGAYEAIKSNLGATTDPGATDDSAADYGVGSVWINVTLDKVWQCVDSTATSAVWKDLSSDDGTLDHAALTSNLAWATSGHTGAASNLAGFTGAGAADELTATEVRTLINVEDGADVTDAANVNAAGAVMEADYNAQTVLVAVADDTPVATTVSDSEFVGRPAGGNVGVVTAAQARTILNVEDGAVALPVADTTAVVKGSADATKLVRIEVDGLTTATTRVITMPDKDVTLDDDGDPRPPTAHAASHTDGTDDIQSATAAQKGLATATQIIKLDGIEALADVTDATNVDAAGAVMESDYNAQTVIIAVADDTPVATTVGDSEFVGRPSGGDVGVMTATEARTVLNVEDGADVTDAANVAAAGAVMETLADAKGDIFAATANDAVARLPLGTDGHVLTADSAEPTGVKWAAGGGGGGITGPGSSVDKGRVTWNGTGGSVVADVGLRDYGASATDPTTPTPADGDLYWNTVLKMQMCYDGSRSKWLSVNTAQFAFGRSGNTGAGAYYRGVGNGSMSSTRGRNAEYNGTVVSLTYTRADVDAATFEAVADGVTVGSVPSSATSGKDLTLDGDFSADQVLAARNQSGGNVTNNVQGWIVVRWRA